MISFYHFNYIFFIYWHSCLNDAKKFGKNSYESFYISRCVSIYLLLHFVYGFHLVTHIKYFWQGCFKMYLLSFCNWFAFTLSVCIKRLSTFHIHIVSLFLNLFLFYLNLDQQHLLFDNFLQFFMNLYMHFRIPRFSVPHWAGKFAVFSNKINCKHKLWSVNFQLQLIFVQPNQWNFGMLVVCCCIPCAAE